MTNKTLHTDLVRLIPGWDQCQCDCGATASHHCLCCGHICPECRARPCAAGAMTAQSLSNTTRPASTRIPPAKFNEGNHHQSVRLPHRRFIQRENVGL